MYFDHAGSRPWSISRGPLTRSSPRTEGNCGITRVFSPRTWEQVDFELACRSPCARVALRKSRRSLFPVNARTKSRFSDGEASWVFGNFGLTDANYPSRQAVAETPALRTAVQPVLRAWPTSTSTPSMPCAQRSLSRPTTREPGPLCPTSPGPTRWRHPLKPGRTTSRPTRTAILCTNPRIPTARISPWART